jgi:hypothetical protein
VCQPRIFWRIGRPFLKCHKLLFWKTRDFSLSS